MFFLRSLLTAAAIVAFGGVALATPNALHNAKNHLSPGNAGLNINMGAQNGSGQVGLARIDESAHGLVVKLSLKNSKDNEAAHIHRGTCAKLDPAPYLPLKSVMKGRSTTAIPGHTVAELKKGHYALNVHDAKDLKRYVSCGDL